MLLKLVDDGFFRHLGFTSRNFHVLQVVDWMLGKDVQMLSLTVAASDDSSSSDSGSGSDGGESHVGHSKLRLWALPKV